jgi:hypothetical protein
MLLPLSPLSLTVALLAGANFTFAFTFSMVPHHECLSLASVFPYLRLWRLPIATVRHRADSVNIGHQHICKPNIKIRRLWDGFGNSHGCLRVYLKRLVAYCVPKIITKRRFSTLTCDEGEEGA